MVLTVLWLWAGSAVSGSVVGYQPPNVGAGPLSPSTSNSDVEHSNHGGYSPPKLPSQQQQQQQQGYVAPVSTNGTQTLAITSRTIYLTIFYSIFALCCVSCVYLWFIAN